MPGNSPSSKRSFSAAAMASGMTALVRRYRSTLIAMIVVAAIACWPLFLAPLGRAYLAFCTRFLANAPFPHHYPPLFVAFVVPVAALLLGGCLVVLLRQIAGQRHLHNVLSQRGHGLGTELQEIVTRLQIERRIVTTADPTVYAFCAGLLRPRIYLSRGLVDLLTPEELEAVIRHELRHVTRRDPLRFFVIHLARRVAAPFPVIATLDERVRIRAELAADQAVLAALPVELLVSALVKVVRAAPTVAYGSILAALSPTDARIAALLGRPVKVRFALGDAVSSLAFAAQIVVLLVWLAAQPLSMPAACRVCPPF